MRGVFYLIRDEVDLALDALSSETVVIGNAEINDDHDYGIVVVMDSRCRHYHCQ